jgi:hypothetical protein
MTTRITPLTELLRARKIIENRRHWTRGVAARDRKGIPVTPDDPGASCWCVLGALFRVSADAKQPSTIIAGKKVQLIKSWHLIEAAAGTDRLAEFNDTHSHHEVLDLIDRAIAEARKRR